MRILVFTSLLLLVISPLFGQNTTPIPSVGNVGFGTTTPSEQLEVVGNSLFNGNIGMPGDRSIQNVLGDNSKGYIRFLNNPGSLTDNWIILYGGNNPLRFDSNLKMNGGVYVKNILDENVQRFESGSLLGVDRPLSQFRPLYFHQMSDPSILARNDLHLSFANETGITGQNFILSSGNGSGNNTQTELLRVQQDGKIGIGTNQPGELLDVNGNTKVQGNLQVNGAITATTHIKGVAGDNDPNAKFQIYGNTGSWDGPYIVMNGTDEQWSEGAVNISGYYEDSDVNENLSGASISFGTKMGPLWSGSSSDYETHMIIQKNGQVQIGTSSIPAGYRLSVKEGIITEKLRVAIEGTSNWADYVFEDAYVLPELDEVDTYIQTHGHLPGVPSAKEVAENGIDVAQMDATLLQKIEELTLYMIELKQENAELKESMEHIQEENAQLNKQIQSFPTSTHSSH